jgi:outer membrane protein assembly factor BamB
MIVKAMNRTPHALVTALLTLAAAVPAPAADWPQLRGPTGDGHYAGPALLTEWGPAKNVAWKAPIPGRGWSSPVVCKGRVYLTTAVEQGEKYSLRALAVDAANGTILWDTEVFAHDAAAMPKTHAKNSQASPTPVTDGQRLYVHFGHLGTAALDLDGKVLWRNDTFKYKPVHGNGGSPILVGDKLVFSCDGSDVQLVVALDTATGAVAWKTPRNGGAGKSFSFATPHVITVDGGAQIVSPGSNVLAAYDPGTGREIWRARFDGYSLIQRPVFGHGLVFAQTGFDSPTLLAVKPGRGDVTATNVAWTTKRAVPHTPSFLLVGDELYMVSDRGVVTCLDAKTGKVHWSERLPGGYSASPIYHDGKIWLTNEEGAGTVLRAGKTFQVLARNDLTERTLASFAAADGALYVRTEKHLYRFGVK